MLEEELLEEELLEEESLEAQRLEAQRLEAQRLGEAELLSAGLLSAGLLAAGLLERAQQGDPHAFQQLISPHLPSLRRFAFSFTRSWSDADDLTQEALLKAFRSLKTFEGRSQLSTWLYVIVRSVGRDLHRIRLRHARELGGVELPEQRSEESNAEEQLSALGDSQELWRAIKQLDAEFRIVLVLFEIEGLSYEEIAAIERVPIGTIRSRLSRARAHLKGLLLKGAVSSREAGTSGLRLASHQRSTR